MDMTELRDFEPTDEQCSSACLSYRHDFGLMPTSERQAMMFQAREWLRTWQKEIRALPLPPVAPMDAEVAELLPFLRTAESATREQLVRGAILAADLIERLAREKAEAERRVKWVEAEINSCMDANFRQAMCINNTASALGPEISATIDGLPKAARHVRTRAEKAEAEVARLREAREVLDRIAKRRDYQLPSAADIARAFLTQKGEDHE